MRDRDVVQRRAGAVLAMASTVVLVAQFTQASGAPRHTERTTPAPAPVARRTTTSPPAAPASAQRRSQRASAAEAAELDRAVDDVLAHSAFIQRGGGTRRDIALTFDDGPGPYTPKVLVELNKRNAKATFFVVGQQERRFHTATMAEIYRGHAVGDHTEGHARLASLPAQAQYDQLVVPMQWLSMYGLPRPRLFRPPYGSYNQTTLDQARRLRMLMVLWTVDSEDYREPGVGRIVDKVVAAARPGAIILMHDGGGDRSQTIAAIPKIIGRLRAKHYHFVTVPELLRDDPPPAGRELPTLRSEG
jgi:peptidoglycan/xylan/chitin deacetylase (PgdA/CDA1 family)